MEQLTKPRSMTVEAFVNRLKVMVRYVNDIPFPGLDPPMVNQTKLKNIIFCAMPIALQTNFFRVNDVSTSTVLQLQQFMSQEREFAEPQNNRGNPNQRRHDNIWDTGNNCRAGRGRNNYSGYRRPWNNNNSDTRNVRPKMNPRDNPCRLHIGTHPWSQCRQNPRSQKFQDPG